MNCSKFQVLDGSEFSTYILTFPQQPYPCNRQQRVVIVVSLSAPERSTPAVVLLLVARPGEGRVARAERERIKVLSATLVRLCFAALVDMVSKGHGIIVVDLHKSQKQTVAQNRGLQAVRRYRIDCIQHVNKQAVTRLNAMTTVRTTATCCTVDISRKSRQTLIRLCAYGHYNTSTAVVRVILTNQATTV